VLQVLGLDEVRYDRFLGHPEPSLNVLDPIVVRDPPPVNELLATRRERW